MATTRRSTRTGGSATANRRQVSGSAATAAAVATGAAEEPQVLSTGDWRDEYGYVLTDLRKLLITSGVLVVAIIVIGFFI